MTSGWDGTWPPPPPSVSPRVGQVSTQLAFSLPFTLLIWCLQPDTSHLLETITAPGTLGEEGGREQEEEKGVELGTKGDTCC